MNYAVKSWQVSLALNMGIVDKLLGDVKGRIEAMAEIKAKFLFAEKDEKHDSNRQRTANP
jgi:hypothetical protein